MIEMTKNHFFFIWFKGFRYRGLHGLFIHLKLANSFQFFLFLHKNIIYLKCQTTQKFADKNRNNVFIS